MSNKIRYVWKLDFYQIILNIISLSLSLCQTEIPVPEQFKTVWDGQKLVTTATEIAG